MRRLVLAFLLGFGLGVCMTPPKTLAQGIERKNTGSGSFTSDSLVDPEGYVVITQQLPFRVEKQIQPSGMTRYSLVTRDNGQEKVIAFADY